MSIRFDHVQKRFGHHLVVKDLALELGRGDRVTLTGPNGSGKTTVLRMGAGLLRPTSGSVTRSGINTTDVAGRHGTAYVGQDNPVYAELTVREHLAWWARLQRTDADVDAWLDDAHLRNMAESPATALSRGQRQRLHLCMALLMEPSLLLLDEPTSALDRDGKEWLIDHLSSHRATMLVATHDDALADTLQSQTRVMEAGWLR